MSQIPTLSDEQLLKAKQESNDYNNDPFEHRFKRISFTNINNTDENIWFEVYPPEVSNLIEQEFRKFAVYGNPTDFWISSTEKIDFLVWKHFNDSTHEAQPNSSFRLHHESVEVDSDEIWQYSQTRLYLRSGSFY